MLPDKNKCIISLRAILIFGFLLTSLISYYTSRASLRGEFRDNELPLAGGNIGLGVTKYSPGDTKLTMTIRTDRVIYKGKQPGRPDRDRAIMIPVGSYFTPT